MLDFAWTLTYLSGQGTCCIIFFCGLCVMCCTCPTTIDLVFYIGLLFYTHYYCYSFILTLFLVDTMADLK
jgi:hypothetical protein